MDQRWLEKAWCDIYQNISVFTDIAFGVSLDNLSDCSTRVQLLTCCHVEDAGGEVL